MTMPGKYENSPSPSRGLETLAVETIKGHRQNKLRCFFAQELPDYLSSIDKLYARWRSCHKEGERKRIARKFLSASEAILDRAGSLEELIRDKVTLNRVKRLFRKTIGSRIYRSNMLRRGYEKPLGYPGDFQLIEAAYENKPLTEGVGELADLLFLNDSYIVAVRHRKEEMRRILEHRLSIPHGRRVLRILNLGAGSCRELREIDHRAWSSSGAHIELFLLDRDKKSLAFSVAALKKAPNITVRTIETDVVDYARHPARYMDFLGELDLVYCIGLADYLPEFYLSGVIRTSSNLLRAGGEFVIAHKDLFRHKSLASDWICDWTFIPRSRAQFGRLVKESLGKHDYSCELRTITSGHVYFVIGRRKAFKARKASARTSR